MIKSEIRKAVVAYFKGQKNVTIEDVQKYAKEVYDVEMGVVETKYIIGLIIGIYLLAALIPSAISALNEANTTGWTGTQTAIWAVVSIIILAVIIMKISE